MSSIDRSGISCRYLGNAVDEAVQEVLDKMPKVPDNVVVPGGDANTATTKGERTFRGKCGQCERRFTGSVKLREIEGAHILGKEDEVIVYSTIGTNITLQYSGACLDEQTSG